MKKLHLTERYQKDAVDKLISELKIKLAANEEYIKELEEEQKIKQLEGEVKRYKTLLEEQKQLRLEWKQKYKEALKDLEENPFYRDLQIQIEKLKSERDFLIVKLHEKRNKAKD